MLGVLYKCNKGIDSFRYCLENVQSDDIHMKLNMLKVHSLLLEELLSVLDTRIKFDDVNDFAQAIAEHKDLATDAAFEFYTKFLKVELDAVTKQGKNILKSLF